MKKLLLTSAAILGLGASVAFASVFTDQVTTNLQGLGYTTINFTTGATQLLVEAYGNGQHITVIYDLNTGAILQQSVEPTTANPTPGVSNNTSGTDFLGGTNGGSGFGDDDGDDDSGSDDNDGDGFGSDDDGNGDFGSSDNDTESRFSTGSDDNAGGSDDDEGSDDNDD